MPILRRSCCEIAIFKGMLMKPYPEMLLLVCGSNRTTDPRLQNACRIRSLSWCPHLSQHQRGIVLIIALIMLAVISLLTITSIRNATSTESVSANVRTTELATQAAEIALRHCEASVLATLTADAGSPSTYPTTFKASNIQSSTVPAQWQSMANWDSASSSAYILPLSMVNQTGMTTATYRRPPECMVERLPLMPSGTGAVVSTSTSFLITSRGFGPEVVVASDSRSRPVGSEVWMQSQIDVH